MIKTNNQLSKVSQEEQLSLQSKLRGSAPVTPVETKVLGGNQDQAKMAGTAQQKQGVLKGAIKGTENLQTTLRQQQDRTQATETEADKSSAAGRLQNLSGLQDRVQAATQGILNQQQAQLTEVGQAKLSEDPELDSLLNQFKTDPSDPQLLLSINQKLGKTKVGEELNAEQIKDMFNLDIDAVSTGLAENIQDDVFVGDLDLAAIGGLTQEELSSLLNIPVDLIGTLSVAGLRAEIDSQIKEEFTDVQNLERKVSDVNMGPAERAEARRQLKDMGAVGIRSVESEMDKLADSIEDSETVEFMGEQIDIQTLLDDSYLSGVAASYLNPETSKEWKDKFKAENPEMAEWIDTHQTALTEAVKNIDTGTQAFSQIQLNNQLLAKAPDGQELSDSVMERIIPGWGTLQSSEFNKEQIPMLKILGDPLKKTQALNLTSALRELENVNPEIITQLSGLTEEQLGRLGILNNTSGWKNYTGYLKDQKAVQQIDRFDPNSSVRAMFGPSATTDQVMPMLAEYVRRINSGLFTPPLAPPMDKMLGSIKDPQGNIIATYPRNATEFANKLQQITADNVSPQDLLNGKTVNGFSDKASLIRGFAEKPSESNIYSEIKDLFNTSSTLTASQITQRLRDTSKKEQAYTELSKAMSTPQRELLKENILADYRFTEIENVISEAGLSPTPSELSAGLSGEYNPTNYLSSMKLPSPGTAEWQGASAWHAANNTVTSNIEKLKDSIALLENSATSASSPLKKQSYQQYVGQLSNILARTVQQQQQDRNANAGWLDSRPKQKQWHGLF